MDLGAARIVRVGRHHGAAYAVLATPEALYYRAYATRSAITLVPPGRAITAAEELYSALLAKLLESEEFKRELEAVDREEPIRVYDGSGALHGFYEEIGRISITSGAHYDVALCGGKLVICDHKGRCAKAYAAGHDLRVDLPGEAHIVYHNYFTERPDRERYAMLHGGSKAYDLVSFPGLGAVTPEAIAEAVVHAVGKYIAWKTGEEK